MIVPQSTMLAQKTVDARKTGVFDAASFIAANMDIVDFCITSRKIQLRMEGTPAPLTAAGDLTIEQRLHEPFGRFQDVVMQQQAVAEVKDDKLMRASLRDALGMSALYEGAISYLVYGGAGLPRFRFLTKESPRERIARTQKGMRAIPAAFEKCLPPKSSKLRDLLERIHVFTQTEAYRVLRGSSAALPSATRATMLRSRILTPLSRIYAVKKSYLSPFINAAQSAAAQDAFEAIANIDEIFAYAHFTGKLPELSDQVEHFVRATALYNWPQAALTPPNRQSSPFIPFNIDLGQNERLTFLTGPNSGGKTSLSKALIHAAVQTQMGMPVHAFRYATTVADRIFYIVGEGNHLQSTEGSMGEQLKRIKYEFEHATPRSFGILDEMIEGTSYLEKMEHTADLLCGFNHIGAHIIYSSHMLELARAFQAENIGAFQQMGFVDDKPTYEVLPGIATTSGFDALTDRVKFHRDAMTESLVERGYLEQGADLRSPRHNSRPERDSKALAQHSQK
ncbi:MAG: hypothetical protein OXR66_09205 [Candidatus Woesearchaeota archaeon]|nr:hypothetical protein [Candidatus Woesearchaeota archaeon]